YCLWLQFDSHPEKLVFGRTGVSGIRFFFWDSQFGRFFNTGPIRGSGDPFFYFHTLLWAFLPWSLLLYAAMFQKCRRRRAFPGDLVCLGAALASFIVFSLSRFQLPHYLNILFPFFSILTAAYLYGVHRRGSQKTIRILQNGIAGLLPILLLALCWFFHFSGWMIVMVVIVGLALTSFTLFRDPPLPASIVHSFWMALLVFSFVNFILYPTILQYQAGTVAGHYMREVPPPGQPVYLLQEAPVDYSFEFDCPHPVERVPIHSLPANALVFAPTAFADTLAGRGLHATPLQSFPNFHISQLTGEFVNWRTRATVLTPWSLMRVEKK
ncbi:MAG TPA: glycosyl transferase, partial [Puia sp.]